MRLHRTVFGSFAACALLAAASLQAKPSFRAYETPLSIEKTKESVEPVLEKLKSSGYQYRTRTMGFSYLITDRWNSPYTFELYIGKITTNHPKTLIRLEGPEGQIESLARILEVEKILSTGRSEEGARPLSKKHYVVAQGLNWIAPWIGTAYEGYHSPLLTKRQMFKRMLYYFAYDAFVIAAGSNNFFIPRKRSPFEWGIYNLKQLSGIQDLLGGPPADHRKQNIIAALLLGRLFASIQSVQLIRGHNNLAELKYTFNFY